MRPARWDQRVNGERVGSGSYAAALYLSGLGAPGEEAALVTCDIGDFARQVELPC